MGHGGANRHHLREMLRNVPYLAGLDEQGMDELMRQIQLQRFPPGHTLFIRGEGQEHAPFYLVVEGTVRVFISSLQGREQVLRYFYPGDTFGEVPLFDGGAYPANADTLTDVILALLPRQQFLQLMADYPEFTIGIVNIMADRLRHFSMLIEDLSLRRVISRVAHFLAEDRPAELTQTQIAAMIGASREMVNRSLHKLEDDGIIALGDDGSISILDLERLTQVVDEV